MPFADIVARRPDDITVTTAYTDKELMLTVPGSSYQKDGSWSVPLSWASCLVLRGTFGAELHVGPTLVEWAQRERRRVEKMTSLREALDLQPGTPGAQAIDDVEAGSPLKLKPYQRAGVAYLVIARTAGLLDEMGTGKTATIIRTLQVLDALSQRPFPAVVVAPNSVKSTVWRAEVARWAPELTVSVVDGSMSIRRKQIADKSDITVINWEAVKLHSRVAGFGDIRLTDKDREEKELNWLQPRTVVADEAHRLRDPKSAQSRAVKWLAHKAAFRYVLTGTPVDDDAFDLWGLLHVVAPEWHPGKTRYGDRYVNIGFGLFGGISVLGLKAENQEEFRQVTRPLYRRILKAAVLPQLPPKLPVQVRLTPMTPKQAKAYKEMEEAQLAQLNDLLVASTPLAALTRLLQFAAANASVEHYVDSKGKARQKVTLEEPSAKVDDLIELLDEMGDDPLVVAAVSRQLVELAAARLEKHGISYGLITGGVSPEDRAIAVKKFQAGQVRVILLVLEAGAEGLTLTKSRVILFMQEDWQPHLNQQAEDRIHRIGAEVHNSVQVIRQVTPGTVEERKHAVIGQKLTRIEEVLQDKESLRRLLGG